MNLKAYAKINLILNILGKREDGYHEIDTVMQEINLYDEISLTDSNETKCICYKIEIDPKINLALQAANIIKTKYAPDKNIEIKINKNIPIQSGLAGGSSDAAAVINGLNEMWNLNLSQEDKLQIGKELGSDVCFFLKNGAKRAKGRGNELSEYKINCEYYLVLCKPNFGIQTKDAYAELVVDNLEIKKIAPSIESYEQLKKSMHNTFEKFLFKKYPKLNEIKQRLLELGCDTALLSGSGSTVYGIVDSRQKAIEIADQIKEKGTTFVCQSI